MVDRPIFGIFEGGGARGVAHIGALAACEDSGFFFVGVAGASAGAIIATLIAAGFDANDILDPNDVSTNILYRYEQTPTKLLGLDEWERYRVRRDGLRPLFEPKKTPRKWRALWCVPHSLQVVVETWRQKGHFSTNDIRTFINAVLRDRLAEVLRIHGAAGPAPERITFSDLDWTQYPEFIPLKIMAACVSTQEAVIFDRERTPKVEIAQAVAASIAIPIAFRPVTLELERGKPWRFVDGGTVSNLPVWVFNDEKLAYERANPGPPVPVVGFTLKTPPPAKCSKAAVNQDGFVDYLAKGVTTALSGSQRAIQDFVEDLRVVALETTLDTLQFDASEDQLLACRRQGYTCATRELRHYLLDQPDAVNLQLQLVYDKVRTDLVNRLPTERRRENWVLRANIVQRFGRDAFRVTYGVNMEQDNDDRMPLDRGNRGAPRAYQTGAPVFTPINARHPTGEPDFLTKYERALVRKDIAAIVSVPIYATREAWELPVEDRDEPCGVLSFDSDRDKELEAAFDDPAFKTLLITQSLLLYRAITMEPVRG